MSKNLYETGERPEDANVEEGNLERESLSTKELVELPDDELKEYGIDDPKQWKSYQRLLHKKENEWAEKQKLYEEKLGAYDSQFEQLKGEIQSIKSPPKEETKLPVLSPKPSNFDMGEALTDPSSASAKWYNEYQDFLVRKIEYQDNMINSLSQKVVEDERMRTANQQKEIFKSRTIASLQENGLEPKDAVDAYNLMESIYASDIKNGTKQFADLFKGRSKSPKEKDFDQRKAKKDDFLPPGLESSGAVPADSEGTAFMKEMQGSNKTKQIIGQRTKKR